MSHDLEGGAIANPQAVEAAPTIAAGKDCSVSLDDCVAGNLPPDESRPCLHDLIWIQAARTPDAIAVVCGLQRVTYRELAEQALKLAERLRNRGVGRETLVGLAVGRSPTMVAAILAIVEAGGAYVPLDLAYPKERLDFVIEDAAMPLLVTEQAFSGAFSKMSGRMVFTDEAESNETCADGAINETFSDLKEGGSRADRAARVSEENLAYVIYTSGSTGKPKGVCVEHRNVVAFLQWAQTVFDPEELSGVLAATSICFDLSVFELFLPLITGGTVILAANALELPALAAREEVTLINTVPSAIAELARAGAIPSSVRTINLAGEPLSQALVAKLYGQGTVCKVYDLYGPSETTTYSTFALRSADRPATIGRAITGTQVHLMDEAGRPAPEGEPGELYIGGAGVTRGYWNRPELTAERYVSDPYSSDPEARLYRTGDLARWLADGNLEFLGRLDQQVKIRGYRIELGEIETVLSTHPQVATCAVVARRRGEEERMLAAFVTGPESATLAVGPLRRWLGQTLPEYMIPASFTVLPALPLLANGKVDRKSLESYHGKALAAGEPLALPATETEQALAEIWQATLGVERVGVDDRFFDLCGHSLQAMAVCSEVTRRLGVKAPVQWMFEHPTIAQFAARLRAGEQGPNAGAVIAKTDVDGPRPMSFGQERMWLLQQSLPDPATYNEPIAFLLRGAVDAERVCLALQAMQERREILRTALFKRDEVLLQEALPYLPTPWRELDLRDAPSEARDSTLRAELLAEARRPFDLARPPLWRALWVTLAEGEHALALTFHHSIVDEWTLRLLLRELETLYAAASGGAAAALEELPICYGDFAEWQRRQLEGESGEQLRRYWREALRDLSAPLELPADHARPTRGSGRGGAQPFSLEASLTAPLRELARREGVTLFTLLLAAFEVWLHRYSGQDDLVVGTPMAMREQPETQLLAGFFLNTLPIRARFEGAPSFLEILARTRDTLVGAYRHAELPFEQIADLAQEGEGSKMHSLYRALFVLVEERLPKLQLGEVRSQRLPVSTRTAKCDVTLSLEAVGDVWDGQLEYDADLFSEETAGRMAGHFCELLRSIARDPAQSIAEVSLVAEEERRRLLEWSGQETDYPREKCVHQLFEDLAQRTPNAIAVVGAGQSISYGALNERADRIARRLQALGVARGDLVGLKIERSIEMVAAVLGILKTGAAYWALEENLPDERYRLLLEEARPRALIFRKDANGLSALEGVGVVAAVEELLEPLPNDQPPVSFPAGEASDAAYVNYTSGSTGRPKGVVVPHRGVVRLVRSTDYLSLTAEEVLLHVSPLSFDASTLELWGALLNGGRVVLMPPGPPALTELGEIIRTQGVTTLWLTAALFHLMVDERLEDLRPLRQLAAGGDVLSPERVNAVRRALPHCRIVNGYGPTENTTFTCCFPVTEEVAPGASVPIGRPIPNTRVYVLDGARQLAPLGVAGELYAGGDGVACGYLHEPTLTTERFVADPFSAQAGARLYRTGDRVRWRADGNLEFLGRMDSQVKIRGFRIELGEIEFQLRAHLSVREALVVAREDRPGEKVLVAYLVAKIENRPDAARMRTYLALTLPEYMLPAEVVWMERFPLTPSGKIDRAALPAPERKESEPLDEQSQPVNLLELELLRIWRKLFQRDDIGRYHNFFSLGGNSLLAAQLAAEIGNLLGRKLPIAALFQSPTTELLAQRLADDDWAPLWSSLVPLQPLGTKPPLFFIHGWGGDVFSYLPMAKLLGSDQPTYGVQAVGLDGRSVRHTTVDEMAAHYVLEIRSLQPEGPYYLGGFSMGGLLAYDVAQLLVRDGHEVALLALLDSAPVGPVAWPQYLQVMLGVFLERMMLHVRNWLKAPWKEKVGYVQERMESTRQILAKNRQRPPAVTSAPQIGSEPPAVPGYGDYYYAVACAHRLKPYPGKVEVFESDEADHLSRLYWRSLARGGAIFHRTPGQHMALLRSEECREALTKQVLESLQRAQAEASRK